MSIYSTNDRVGAAATIVADESYRPSDIGRIMYESQLNDQAIFEATLMADFAEINGLREGTLLESEIAAFNEANAKTFFAGLKERLMRFWEKIKGVFKAATQKIAAYILRDGKAFVKEFDTVARTTKRKPTGEFPKAKIVLKIDDYSIPTETEAMNKVKEYRDGDAAIPAYKDLVKEILAKKIEVDSIADTGDFKKKALEKFVGEVDIDSKNIEAEVENMKKYLSDAKSTISEIKDTENEINRNLSKLRKVLEDEEREANKDDNTVATHKRIKKLSAILSVYEDVVSSMSSAKISATKEVVKNSRKILSTIMGNMKKTPSTINDSADIIAVDEVEMAFDDDLSDIDSYTESQIERLLSEI